jgi:hypothetical protein
VCVGDRIDGAIGFACRLFEDALLPSVLIRNGRLVSLGLFKILQIEGAIRDAIESEDPLKANAQRCSKTRLMQSIVVEKEHTSHVLHRSCVSYTLREPRYINSIAAVVWKVQHSAGMARIKNCLKNRTWIRPCTYNDGRNKPVYQKSTTGDKGIDEDFLERLKIKYQESATLVGYSKGLYYIIYDTLFITCYDNWDKH